MSAAPDPTRTPPSGARARRDRAHAGVGRGTDTIDTPALVIDLDAMERNIARMAVFAQTPGLRLRPHAKPHKSAEPAQRQMQAGAVGVCAQKTDEALALVQAGVRDVYISNEVIDPAKLLGLARAGRDLPTRFGIAVDSSVGAERVGERTGTFALEAASGLWGELQAGAYLFMDADYAANEAHPDAPTFEHALFIKAQVMSRCTRHAVSALGDTVWLIPGHCGPTGNLHDIYIGVRGGLQHGRVERVIDVDARGALG